MKTPGARAFGACAQGIFLVGRQLQPLRHHEVHALLASLACAAVEVQASCVCVVCARVVCRRMCVPPRNEMCGAAPDDVCVVHQECARCGMHRDVIECGTPSSVPRCVLVSRTSSSRSSGEKKPNARIFKLFARCAARAQRGRRCRLRAGEKSTFSGRKTRNRSCRTFFEKKTGWEVFPRG